MLPLKPVLGEDTTSVSFALSAIFGYGGLLLGLSKGKGISIAGIFRLFRGQSFEENLKILDTSVIIDGRIADVCEAGFLEGVFVLPQFILQELQHIADAADPIKRARGRRGLDILHKIQKMSHITVRIVDEDFPKIREVDAKLVALARLLNAKVITNDFNLNKVAELQGVSVLNINELANALKPVVLPGETMKVFVLKEGKEHNQGVAYLDDGTMVVVENARRLIGKNAEVTVTSVLQTTAGRMIFSKTREEYEREEYRAIK
ncbi:MAG: TRAM domain-containing protein [Nitrospirae bacterium]|nr:TRAM domain-containing protein [Nitrospirota bacterium]